MIDSTMQQALRDSVHEVLERMFFIDVTEESSAEQPVTSPCGLDLAAQLTFQGNPSGALTLQVSCAAARQFAADFLGLDEDEVGERKVGEVVCELANMVCGSLLSRVESSAVFQLAAPRIVALPDAPSTHPAPTRYTVTLPNGTLTVLVTIGTPICLEPVQSEY